MRLLGKITLKFSKTNKMSSIRVVGGTYKLQLYLNSKSRITKTAFFLFVFGIFFSSSFMVN